jgi:formamidopyrimidine-DNA glycosylase
MQELPDIVVYIEALEARIRGARLERVRITGPFLLRTASPSIQDAEGRTVRELRRVGKRIAIGLEGDLWLVLHLMIAGRLHWRERGVKVSRKRNLAAFDFTSGSLLLTEAGSQRRASLHVVAGEEGLRSLDPGGLEVLECDLGNFSAALTRANHTLKRALTDPRLFSGIGNAYSDEILHRTQLSPVALTQRLSSAEIERLYVATRETLVEWTERLRARQLTGGFPEKVTAFRQGMAVHGRYGRPCPRCQTGGKQLADRALSRLLKEDWPRTLEEWESLVERSRKTTLPA